MLVMIVQKSNARKRSLKLMVILSQYRMWFVEWNLIVYYQGVKSLANYMYIVSL